MPTDSAPSVPASSLRALIFDFDGLMVDTEWPAFEAWSAIYREHGAELALERWVAAVGTMGGFDPCQALAELIGRPVDGAALLADKERRKSEICDRLPFMPGVLERIAEARSLGLRVAVASTSRSDWVHKHLHRLERFHAFDAVLTGEQVARVKPFPDLYLAAAAAIGVAPSFCLVLEDSLNGVRAAKAAGMRCIAVPNRVTRILDFSLADERVESLAKLSVADVATRLFPE